MWFELHRFFLTLICSWLFILTERAHFFCNKCRKLVRYILPISNESSSKLHNFSWFTPKNGYENNQIHFYSLRLSCAWPNTYSQPLRHKRMGKGVHFMFEVVSRLKIFRGTRSRRLFFEKRGPKCFFRGCPHFGGRNSFFSVLWPILVILVCIYMFSAMTNRLQ